MLSFLVNTLLTIVAILLGAYILFFGRRALSATLGIIALSASANTLAVLFTASSTGRDLVQIGAWSLVAASVGLAVIGALIGYYYADLAAKFVGFIAGASIALWFLDVASYALSSVAQISEQWTAGVVIVLIVIGGIAGLWLIKVNRHESLIILSVLVGVELLGDALRLNPSSSFTAIIYIGLVLAGVLAQYADYLRENQRQIADTLGEPNMSSLALFQEIDLS